MENKRFQKLMRDAAAEGSVLLRNNAKTLPVVKDDCVSVFGRCQFDWYKSGTGSGGSVNVPYTTNLTDSLVYLHARKGTSAVNMDLVDKYRAWIKDNPKNLGTEYWAAEPWSQKEMPLDEQTVTNEAKSSNKALVVIGRTAGEDKDNSAQKGSYLLTDEEIDMIQLVCSKFDKVAVILNVSNIIDMKFIDDPRFNSHITAVLYVWQGGMEGGMAAAEVMTGLSVPSGKLPDTIAHSIEDYPAHKNFGDLKRNFYVEDIYVGYRWFETFCKDKVMFPFGFGMSYTKFDVEILSSSINGYEVAVKARVKNVGDEYSGKETVQIYLECPQGALGKPARALASFKKTTILHPGQSQTVEMRFNLADFASYDDSGSSGNEFCFVLEKGKYFVYAGTDVRMAKKIDVGGIDCINIEETVVIKRLEQALAPREKFSRAKPAPNGENGCYSVALEDVPLSKVDMAERRISRIPKEMTLSEGKIISFDEAKRNPSLMAKFVAQLSNDEMAQLTRGEGMSGTKVTIGTASAFGGLSSSLHEHGIPAGCCSDGPSGIRLDSGMKASLIPIGTALAATWNSSIVRSLYKQEGLEVCSNRIDLLLGPGVNIHRHPLCGRNFEYFSEDPLLAGKIASSALLGLRDGGAEGVIKHFACNNQEAERHNADSIVSERALREVYLRVFEIAVNEGKARALMSSYNMLNGSYTASSYDLLNTILRREWGFNGLVMTDWWAAVCKPRQRIGGKLDYSAQLKDTAAMIRAGGDVFMVVDDDGAETNVYGDNTIESINDGSLSKAELQARAFEICSFLAGCQAAKRPLGELKPVWSFKEKRSSLPNDLNVYAEGQIFTIENVKVLFEARESGIYSITGAYLKTHTELLWQSSACVLVDGFPVATMDCRDTEGNVIVKVIGKVRLRKGRYVLSIAKMKPGICVKSLRLDIER